MLADDLMAAVFPDAAACLENIPGDRQIPDHPLVKQTVRDCLQEAMDYDGLSAVLDRIHRGDLELVARDVPEPSIFAHEILNAKPYAFLDDAPLEERRAHAVQTRRSGDPASAGDLGALDPDAIDRVRDEARPDPRDADELHDALLTAGFLTEKETDSRSLGLFEELVSARRATRVSYCANEGGGSEVRLLVAAERLPEMLAVRPDATLEPRVEAPASRAARTWRRDEAIDELLRGRLAIVGPTTADALRAPLGISARDADAAMIALEADGVVLRGRFTPVARSTADRPGIAVDPAGVEWCDRALLTRIHRYTLHRLRAEIEPVSAADFMRFLFAWQHLASPAQLAGLDGLRVALAMLDGFEAAAGAWERAILPARMHMYEPQMLDMLCLAGEVGWARFSVPAIDPSNLTRLVSATPVALFLREHGDAWHRLRSHERTEPGGVEAVLGDSAQLVLETLRARGASFFADLVSACGLGADVVREAIGTLVACGLVASDGFSGLRALVSASQGRPQGRTSRASFAGRWGALSRSSSGAASGSRESDVEQLAWALLRRYGIVFRRLLARESNAAPWRELTRVYRRLEARGEIRGGRFLRGTSGEQFALPDAVSRLRDVRRTAADGRLVTISAADPLNLSGIVTSGDRIRAAARTRIVYRDGIPLAVKESDFVRELVPCDAAFGARLSRALGRRGSFPLARTGA
jgi:ATP-dependent Lhr-like helicase